jgi:Predicted permeases
MRTVSRKSVTCAISKLKMKDALMNRGMHAMAMKAENRGIAAIITGTRRKIKLSTYLLYGTALLLLLISFIKDKKRTKMALKKAWKSFENILPQFLVVLLVMGVMLAILNAEVISKIIGADSGWLGVALGAVVGAVTLIPGFVAFPMAAMLVQNGAGYMQIGAFVSSLMMVGIVTIPVEIKYFGKKLAILRNVTAFVFSFFVAFIIGMVVR